MSSLLTIFKLHRIKSQANSKLDLINARSAINKVAFTKDSMDSRTLFCLKPGYRLTLPNVQLTSGKIDRLSWVLACYLLSRHPIHPISTTPFSAAVWYSSIFHHSNTSTSHPSLTEASLLSKKYHSQELNHPWSSSNVTWRLISSGHQHETRTTKNTRRLHLLSMGCWLDANHDASLDTGGQTNTVPLSGKMAHLIIIFVHVRLVRSIPLPRES